MVPKFPKENTEKMMISSGIVSNQRVRITWIERSLVVISWCHLRIKHIFPFAEIGRRATVVRRRFKICFLGVHQLAITADISLMANPKKAAGSHGNPLIGRHMTFTSGQRADESHKLVVYYARQIARQLACACNVNLFHTSRSERSWLRGNLARRRHSYSKTRM